MLWAERFTSTRRSRDHPAVDRGGEAEALGRREEVARHDQLAVVVQHAHEQLLLDDLAARQIHDRLAVQHEPVVLDRVADAERPLHLGAERVLALVALGHVDRDAAHAGDAVLVPQRELLDEVAALASVHRDALLGLDRAARIEHLLVARHESLRQLGG
jgi:hypothetical protein